MSIKTPIDSPSGEVHSFSCDQSRAQIDAPNNLEDVTILQSGSEALTDA